MLERIARLEDPELYDRTGSVRDVMGENRKGLAVMRLVPNTPPATLERVSRSDNSGTRLHLSWNRGAPRQILERLARDPDESVARNARQALKMRP